MSTSNRPKPQALRDGARILWAITANDLVAALKNKNTLPVILMALLMVCVYRFLPLLEGASDRQTLLVYDAGQSTLLPLLETSNAVKVYTYPSEEALKQFLANGEMPELGLVIPAGFDRVLAAGEAVTLQGYVMNWLSPADAAAQQHSAEAEISRLAGRAVTVQIEGNVVYPSSDSHGLPTSLGFALVYVIVMTALPLLPHLFLEEKQARTIDALMVSPAGAGQIVAGKALTGLFYCALGALVALVAFWNVVVHWWLIIPAIVSGSLFVLAIALWLGMRIENRGQLSLTLWMVIIPLLVGVFVSHFENLGPSWVSQVAGLVPTAAMFTLFRLSAAGNVPWETALPAFAWVTAWAIGILALVTLQVRRLDRRDESSPALAPVRAMLSRFLPGRANAARNEPAAGRPLPAPAAPEAGAPGLQAPRAHTPQSGWGITCAIVVKDIREAIRNRIFISIVLGTAVLAGTNTLLPLLFQGQEQPVFVVYDEGRSTILRELARIGDIRLDIVASRGEMEALVGDRAETVVGLVLPADFDERASGGQAIALDAFIGHTADAQRARQWATRFETMLGQAGAGAARIRLDDARLYPSIDAFGRSTTTAIVLGVVIFTLGAAVIPLLLVEEKEAHTLDALLVSPAGLVQVVIGKALTGAAFCLLAAAILIALDRQFFVHWEIALLAVLLTTLFAVSVGLLIGILSDNPATTGMWGSILLLIIVVLGALEAVSIPGIPPLVKQALAWLPGPAALKLLRSSMAGAVPVEILWTNAAALAAAAALAYGAVLWRLRRSDR